jgi:hypothetical protein
MARTPPMEPAIGATLTLDGGPIPEAGVTVAVVVLKAVDLIIEAVGP